MTKDTCKIEGVETKGYLWTPYKGIDLFIYKFNTYWIVIEPVTGLGMAPSFPSVSLKETKDFNIKYMKEKGIDVVKRVIKEAIEFFNNKEPVMGITESIRLYNKRFQTYFHQDLRTYVDSIIAAQGRFSFDVVKFDDHICLQYGYNTNEDGALSEFIEKRFGQPAVALINEMLGSK